MDNRDVKIFLGVNIDTTDSNDMYISQLYLIPCILEAVEL